MIFEKNVPVLCTQLQMIIKFEHKEGKKKKIRTLTFCFYSFSIWVASVCVCVLCEYSKEHASTWQTEDNGFCVRVHNENRINISEQMAVNRNDDFNEWCGKRKTQNVFFFICTHNARHFIRISKTEKEEKIKKRNEREHKSTVWTVVLTWFLSLEDSWVAWRAKASNVHTLAALRMKVRCILYGCIRVECKTGIKRHGHCVYTVRFVATKTDTQNTFL